MTAIPRWTFFAFDRGGVSGMLGLASKTGRAHSLPAPRAKPAGDPTPPLGLSCPEGVKLEGAPRHLLGERVVEIKLLS